MTEITMPKLSDSMEEGTILSWLKQPGEQVELGEDLVEIETDKATVTHPAQAGGVVLELLVAEGTSVAVGAPIVRVGVAAEAAPNAEPQPESGQAPSETPVGSSAVVVPAAAAAPVKGNGDRRRGAVATPLARRVAAVHGIALDDVQGSGPLGRITRGDVLAKAGLADEPSLPTLPTATATATAPAPPPPVAPAPAPDAQPSATTRQQPTRLQQVIARRMAEAKATIPHFQVQTEVAVDAAIALRTELKALADDGATVPSFNDIIIKAAAVALREHPLANGSYKDGSFELHEAVNVGMAVAADDALVVPTVFDAAGKSLGQIARETRALAGRVRSGQITPPELSGGTFTVSNLGMFGMTAITPVINPPQAAILGVGAMREVLARVDGEIVDRTLLTLTLSCDHRILYGADAARFLARIRALLETPLKIAL
jgi:pyruvate dehydrogenase E2 component (dihydrolipoamide acetyltransferase)